MTLVIGCLLVWALLVPHYLQVGRNAVARPPSSDFFKFYLSAQRLAAGDSVYWVTPPRQRVGDPCHPGNSAEVMARSSQTGQLKLGGDLACLGPNLNPPVFMAVMLPLAHLPYATAWWVWAGLSMLCGWWSVALMVRMWVPPGPKRWLSTAAGCTGLLAFYPTLGNHTLGQLGMVLLLGLTLTWWAGRQRREVLAGLCLGALMGLKPFLLVLPLPYLLARRWQLLAVAGATLAGTVLVGGALCGWASYSDYAQVAQHIHWTGANWNGSWTGLLDRAFISVPNSSWPQTRPLSHLLAMGLGLGTLALYAILALQRWHERPPANTWSDDMVATLGPGVALLVSPLGWLYYFPMLLPAACLGWMSVRTGHPPSRPLRWVALGLALGFCVPVALNPSPTVTEPAQWYGLDAWSNLLLVGHVALCASMLAGMKKGA